METNIQIIKESYDKFTSGDIPGLLNHLSDDVQWSVPKIENAPFAGTRHGLGEVSEFFALLDKSEEKTKFEPKEFIAQDDRVIVLGKYAATVRETGRSYESDFVHVFSVKDGKVTSFAEFFDTALVARAFQKATTA